MQKEFEKTHCKIVNKSLYIKETDSGVIFFSRNKLKESYEHLTTNMICKKTGEPKLFIDAWMKGNESIRKYDDCNFYPSPLIPPNNIYNLWRPFECEKYTTPYTKNEEALQLILNHIKILCDHDDVVTDYFNKWIGQMIQYPATKSICPIFISQEGAGKGTLIQLMKKMLGKQKVMESTNPSRDVWGEFNSCMVNSFLVNLNETEKSDAKANLGKIKGLITDTSLQINPKGKDQFEIDSYHRFIITTNKQDPIPTSKSDRRNLIIRSSDELLGNKEYFTNMYNLLEDVNVIRTCYDYFKSIPNLDKFKELEIPKTNYQENLKLLDLSPPEQYLMDLCSKKEGIIEMLSRELYDEFSDFITSNNIEYSTTPLKFGVKLANLKISGIEKGRHTKRGETKLIDIEKLRKHFKIGFVDEN